MGMSFTWFNDMYKYSTCDQVFGPNTWLLNSQVECLQISAPWRAWRSPRSSSFLRFSQTSASFEQTTHSRHGRTNVPRAPSTPLPSTIQPRFLFVSSSLNPPFDTVHFFSFILWSQHHVQRKKRWPIWQWRHSNLWHNHQHDHRIGPDPTASRSRNAQQTRFQSSPTPSRLSCGLDQSTFNPNQFEKNHSFQMEFE